MLDIRPDLIDDPWLGVSEVEFTDVQEAASVQRDEGLHKLPAGIFLAAGLADVDFESLSGAERVEAVTALQRLVSHYQAQMYAGVASIYDYLEEDFAGDMDLATGATAAEVRAALRLTRRSADLTVDLALTLVTRIPVLHEAFLAGAVDVARVKTIVSGHRAPPG